jgi:tetratricopeptide (TPR) repeat protein
LKSDSYEYRTLERKNLQKEIKGHQEAAEVFKRSGSFLEYSRTLLLMGNAYLSLSKIREPEGDLESAIKAYKGALRTLIKKIIRRIMLWFKTTLEEPTIGLLNLEIPRET